MRTLQTHRNVYTCTLYTAHTHLDTHNIHMHWLSNMHTHVYIHNMYRLGTHVHKCIDTVHMYTYIPIHSTCTHHMHVQKYHT